MYTLLPNPTIQICDKYNYIVGEISDSVSWTTGWVVINS